MSEKKYRIISYINPTLVDNEVNQYLNMGWKLLGGLHIDSDSNSSFTVYTQAVVCPSVLLKQDIKNNE